MTRAEMARRAREALAWLRHTAPPPARLTPWGWAADAILAALLTVGAVSGVLRAGDREGPISPFPVKINPGYVAPNPPDPPIGAIFAHHVPLHWWQFALAVLATLPLLARRRYPLVSFLVMAVAAVRLFSLDGADFTWTVLALLIAAYSAGTYSRYRNLALVAVVAAGALIIGGNGDNLPRLNSGSAILLLLALLGLGANAVHTWRQRAQAALREHEATTALAVEHERARLARELHDVVGHNVAVMIIQAGAARKMLDLDPDRARAALLAVEAGGRAAMTELRQVIGVLTVDDGDELEPQPGLKQLPELADRVRGTGVPVRLSVTGTFDDLAPEVELAAYRVVQEALTNAVKHAAGAAVEITVRGTPDELRVEVTDTGGRAGSETGPLPYHWAGDTYRRPAGTGRGLTGLRDRLTALGGTLTAERRPTGGFRVLATAPLGAEA